MTQRQPIDDEISVPAEIFNSMQKLAGKAKERSQHKREFKPDGTVLRNTGVVEKFHHNPLPPQRLGLSCAAEARGAWQMALETLGGIQAASAQEQGQAALAMF
eukprot:gnl/MRDRNA2_/MRDRNA2_168718_c0_seq1.p2 gnl/MRDRNA2_/MRDRNA2_168718_c0~~gnl/MRDRNA2_/MRDRNA2_168718_c0_seq1.p2  ORF type:complete len:103 (+),score=31.47 gnl/MRDRNA2_/MRDRNA2_168718_c0_seq1:257-565(+)